VSEGEEVGDKNREDAADEDQTVIIDGYSRAMALADGVLLDVTELAKEAGIKAPVALTHAVWQRYVELTPAAEQAANDITGRQWDILWMFSLAARENPETNELHYKLLVVTDSIEPSLVELKAVIGPGDHGEAVITILLPDED
jgi:hypothetical protein